MEMKGRGRRWAILAAATAVLSPRDRHGPALLGEGPASSSEVKISDQVLLDTAGGQEASFVIYLGDQADVSAGLRDQGSGRARPVRLQHSRQHAAETQAPIRAALEAQGVSYKPYWAVNMIVAEGDRAVVEDLADRPDVKAIESNAGSDGLQDDDAPETVDEGNAVEATEAGVTNVKGPSLWTLGYTGQGIVVANQDTGMRWTHAALRTHYRGWGGSIATSDHNYNWHDSVHARITNADGGTSSGRSRTRAATTSSRRATTRVTAPIRPVPPSVTTRAPASAPARTRSASHRAPSGSAAATWTPATAGPPPTPSASSSSSRRPTSPGRTPTRRSGRT